MRLFKDAADDGARPTVSGVRVGTPINPPTIPVRELPLRILRREYEVEITSADLAGGEREGR